MPALEVEDKAFLRNRRSSLVAAIFLMATSAIGPGFTASR